MYFMSNFVKKSFKIKKITKYKKKSLKNRKCNKKYIFTDILAFDKIGFFVYTGFVILLYIFVKKCKKTKNSKNM